MGLGQWSVDEQRTFVPPASLFHFYKEIHRWVGRCGIRNGIDMNRSLLRCFSPNELKFY